MDTLNHFRPIIMVNFKYKIISNFLANRLTFIMSEIIYREQIGFIKSGKTKDCICPIFEAIHMLHNKSHGGNIAIKIDTTKTFDTFVFIFCF